MVLFLLLLWSMYDECCTVLSQRLHIIRSFEHLFDRVTYFGQSDKTHERAQETGYVLDVAENSNT